jgi:SAM-dependent methyltransferase
MQGSGWIVTGVEPSEKQYQRAAKLLKPDTNIQQCVLQEARLPGNFDLITLWDVLEHVTEPATFLQLAAQHLREGGYLMLNVPRIDSAIAKTLGPRWPLLLAEHLCYFTIPSLRICGESAHLKLIGTGTRPAIFSLAYVSFRASQHGIPGAEFAGRFLKASGLSKVWVPVWLGEMYAIFRRTGPSPHI